MSSDNAVPIIPSPKYTSNLADSTSWRKYTLLVDVSWVISVASVNEVTVVLPEEVWTLTVSVDVSALLSVIINLWSAVEVSTVYLVDTNVPSYILVLRYGIVAPIFEDVLSVAVTNW